MKTEKWIRLAVLLVAAQAALRTDPAAAQQSGAALEEVLITTQRRQENLQDVPISVSVMQGDTLERLQVRGFEDVEDFVPNLVVQETLGSYSINIRGLGTGAANLAFDQSVGLFVDGVYAGRSRLFMAPFLDIERIEIARGPQGALFGKNTIAGAVSVITAQPSDEPEGQLRAGFEMEHGGTDLLAILSGPLSERLKGRFAASFRDIDGYVENPALGRDEPLIEEYVVRGKLRFDASERFDATLRLEAGSKEMEGYTSQMRSFGGNPLLLPILRAADPDAEDALDARRSVLSSYGGELDETDYLSGALTLNWSVGEYLLTSISAYQEYDWNRYVDVDGTVLLWVDTNLAERFDELSQDLRVTSPTGGRFDFVAGLYYSRTDLFTAIATPLAGLLFGQPAIERFGMYRFANIDTDYASAYAQLMWHVSPRFRAVAGARYSSTEKSGHGLGIPSGFSDVFHPDPADVPAATFAGLIYRAYDVAGERTDEHFDPSIKLMLDVNDDVMLYAGWASGSKAGGFVGTDSSLGNQLHRTALANPGLTAQQIVDRVFQYDDETADAIEVGTKMRLLDGALSLNLAIFSTDFKDLQVAAFDGSAFVIRNAAAASSDGAELELDWRLSSAWRVGAGIGYTDATYDSFPNAQCRVIDANGTKADPACIDGVTGDLTGARLERSPQWQGSAYVDWTHGLANGMSFTARVSGTYSSEYFIQPNLHPLDAQDAYTKWDARVGLAGRDGRWEIALIGRNLGDELTVEHAYPTPFFGFNSHSASISTPRLVTLEGTWRF